MLAGVPLYKVWVVVSKRTATPLNATWAMTALAFFLGLPILFSPSTFLAMGSISFAGLYISCKSPPFSDMPQLTRTGLRAPGQLAGLIARHTCTRYFW